MKVLLAALLLSLLLSTKALAAERGDAVWLWRSFLCIHRYEDTSGRWDTNTGNGYFGGLQLDRDFMRTYGREFYERWGTADRWPMPVQMTVAIRAYLSGRGFYPWPNTARLCGLL